jgi:hypothetical protein
VILLAALGLGLLAGWGRTRWHKQPYRTPEFVLLWLVPAAFLPQLVVAYLPTSDRIVPAWLVPTILPASLLVFLAFTWLNRRLPGMPILMTGLILNLLVISANGGWMPISPDTASHLKGGAPLEATSIGSRFGQKDVLLLPEDTRLEFLSDRFLFPKWVPYQVAFSLGDFLVAIGVFWLLANPKLNELSTE